MDYLEKMIDYELLELLTLIVKHFNADLKLHLIYLTCSVYEVRQGLVSDITGKIDFKLQSYC